METLASPILAAAPLTVINFHWLFSGTAIGFLASAAFVITSGPPKTIAKEVRQSSIYAKTTRGIRVYVKTPRLLGLFAVTLAAAAASAMVIVNTVVIVRGLGLGQQDVALTLAAFGGGSMLAAFVLPRILERVADRPIMIGAAAILVLGLAILAIVTATQSGGLAYWYRFESLQSARLRLLTVVPICFAAIYALLYMALGGFTSAGIVFSAVPMALAGGVFVLLLRGIPFSITAAVGFIALSGVAVLNGLVMMSAIKKYRDDGVEDDEAIIRGAMERVRPVLMTALVASLGFVPMALATGTGAEVQRQLARVVIGGLITSTALTLLIPPAITAFAARIKRQRKPKEPNWVDMAI